MELSVRLISDTSNLGENDGPKQYLRALSSPQIASSGYQ